MIEKLFTADDLGRITIRGRLAYALCFVEQAFLHTGVNSPEAGAVLRLLWSLVDHDAIGDWDNMRRDGQSGEYYFGILDHVDAMNGVRPRFALPEGSPLLEIQPRIMGMMQEVDDLAMAYLYTKMEPGAPRCTEKALAAAGIGREFGAREPPFSLFHDCMVPPQGSPKTDIWGDVIATRPFRDWVRQQTIKGTVRP